MRWRRSSAAAETWAALALPSMSALSERRPATRPVSSRISGTADPIESADRANSTCSWYSEALVTAPFETAPA